MHVLALKPCRTVSRDDDGGSGGDDDDDDDDIFGHIPCMFQIFSGG